MLLFGCFGFVGDPIVYAVVYKGLKHTVMIKIISCWLKYCDCVAEMLTRERERGGGVERERERGGEGRERGGGG